MPEAAVVRRVALGLCALLCACGTPSPRPRSPPSQPVSAQAAPAGLPGAPLGAPETTLSADLYRIDTAHTELKVLIHRSGPMAALGHNHVIVNRRVAGWARWDGLAAHGAFELDVPAAAFSVDEAALRAQAGADFAEEVDAEARKGTRANMLGDAVLAASAHPSIRVRSERIEASGAQLRATVRIEVAGHVSEHSVPFELAASGGTLTAHVHVELLQTALGLTPFSVFLGALRVDDTLHLELDVLAVRAPG
jgi:polyisoprenoid-binding protein YceI